MSFYCNFIYKHTVGRMLSVEYTAVVVRCRGVAFWALRAQTQRKEWASRTGRDVEAPRFFVCHLRLLKRALSFLCRWLLAGLQQYHCKSLSR